MCTPYASAICTTPSTTSALLELTVCRRHDKQNPQTAVGMHCHQLTFPKMSGTAEILCPGRTSLSAASMAVWVAASRSAARPVTGASESD